MFDNIGGKIKTLAKVICWVGIVASAISAVYVGAVTSNLNGALGIVIAIPLVLLGAVLSWIVSFTLYGYGELIELTAKIEQNTRHS